MRDQGRAFIACAIAEDERWVSHARSQLEDGVDCSSMVETIARVEHDIARMRAHLSALD